MTLPSLSRRVQLAHLPTPLWRHDALDRLAGTEVWVKRDDMTAGAAAGNKIRKLEFLLHDAVQQGASTVITCGGVQSNHARATALLARELGLGTILYLRSAEPQPRLNGNVLLDLLAGAEIRWISPEQYRDRQRWMDEAAGMLALQGRRAYVIPEGGSSPLGALGYVAAMREVAHQLETGLAGGGSFEAVAHACGSGGTAAGCVVGASEYGVADSVLAFAVCDDAAYFRSVIGDIVSGTVPLLARPTRLATLTVCDEFTGPAYGVPSAEQAEFLCDVARQTGLVLDPVYSGKALFGLSRLASKPSRVLFLHTGGLPGLLAQSERIATYLERPGDYRFGGVAS